MSNTRMLKVHCSSSPPFVSISSTMTSLFSVCFWGLLSDSRAQIVHCFPSAVSSQERNIQAKFCIKQYLWCSFNAGQFGYFFCVEQSFLKTESSMKDQKTSANNALWQAVAQWIRSDFTLFSLLKKKSNNSQCEAEARSNIIPFVSLR